MVIKYIFIFVTLIHGLIHFMGFSKAFGYGNFTQLTKEISKPMGALWFVTGLLFIICIGLYLLKKDSWACFALLATVLSQVLIIDNWQDAKFGTIANVLILVVTIIGFFQIKFKNEYKNEVKIGLENGTSILKFFLHLSKKEQNKRFLDRIAHKEKHWKFSSSDITERAFWSDYEVAYEQAFAYTNTDIAPWYVIPADDKFYTYLLIAKIIAEKLTSMNPHFPEIDKKEKVLMAKAKIQLLKENE
jgi:Polyphosphate kinase 2 (PPK2)